jgi:hypothetical protein
LRQWQELAWWSIKEMSDFGSLAKKHSVALQASLLAVLAVLLNVHELCGFWRADDTAILLHTLQNSLINDFVSPTVWQTFSTANLTPWLSLSFTADTALAGLRPWFFYLHQLVALAMAAVMSYHVLRLFVSQWMAFAGTTLFLLGTPVLMVSSELMTRHYLEGLLFALAVLYFFKKHQLTSSNLHIFLAVLCYGLAITAKEIYVPLGVVLVLMAHGRWQLRLRQVLPFIVTMGLYIAWRGYMLPALAGGYADNAYYLTAVFWQSVVSTASNLPAILFGVWWIPTMLALTALVAMGSWLQPKALIWAVLLAGLALTPLLPLVSYPGISSASRYLLLPWYLLCFGLVYFLELCLRQTQLLVTGVIFSRVALGACAVLISVTFMHRAKVASPLMFYHQAMDVQMRYVWENDDSQAFVPVADLDSAFWMLTSTRDIKALWNPAASIPKPMLDDLFLDATLPLFMYQAECRCMADISASIPERRARLAAQVRPSAPLQATFQNDDGIISWQLGPYQEGEYSVVSNEIGKRVVSVAQARLRTSIREKFDLYLRYASPEGWITYSPSLRVEANGQPMVWSRSSAKE